MYIALVMLLGIVLAGLSIISLVKNFLIDFNVSDNGWKTILVVLLIVISLLGAVIGYVEAFTIGDINNMQPSSNVTEQAIQQLRELIPIKIITVYVSICIGYIAFFLHILLIKNIREIRRKEMESNAHSRWVLK
jgi:amino acid transporter